MLLRFLPPLQLNGGEPNLVQLKNTEKLKIKFQFSLETMSEVDWFQFNKSLPTSLSLLA